MNEYIPQGSGFSPDGGYCFRKGNLLYWKDGDITDLSAGDFMIRYVQESIGEDFSAWTDEERSKVRAATLAKRDAWRKKEALENIEREELQASAKAKLTDAEFAAVVYLGRYE